jgi:hypothetical protein
MRPAIVERVVCGDLSRQEAATQKSFERGDDVSRGCHQEAVGWTIRR